MAATGSSSRIAPARMPVHSDGALTGTASLVRFNLRRDRWLLPAWIVALAGMAAVSAGATIDLYPSERERVAAAETINATAAFVALYTAKMSLPSTLMVGIP